MVGETGVAMKLQGVEIVKVDEFKYLGSTIQSNGQLTYTAKANICLQELRKLYNI